MNPVPLFLIIVTLPLLLGGCGEKHEGISLDELQNRGKNGYFEKNQEVGYTGKVFKLHENGQIELKGQLIKGKFDGLKVRWYRNGQKMHEVSFKGGHLDGLEVWWDKNGQKKSELKYQKGKLVEGSEKYWNSEGEPVDLFGEALEE